MKIRNLRLYNIGPWAFLQQREVQLYSQTDKEIQVDTEKELLSEEINKFMSVHLGERLTLLQYIEVPRDQGRKTEREKKKEREKEREKE